MEPTHEKRWTITAVSDAGDEVRISENDDATLQTLLTEAVHKLYGEHANVAEYEIVIAGVAQKDLALSLEQAGLHDGSEVVVQVKDVHRG